MICRFALISIAGGKNCFFIKRPADKLHSDGHIITVKSARQSKRRQACNIYHNGVNIAEIHCKRIAEALADFKRRGGSNGAEKKIIFFKSLVKRLNDEPLGLERLVIIRLWKRRATAILLPSRQRPFLTF